MPSLSVTQSHKEGKNVKMSRAWRENTCNHKHVLYHTLELRGAQRSACMTVSPVVIHFLRLHVDFLPDAIRSIEIARSNQLLDLKLKVI